MINILDDTSQRHYLRKGNCGNYLKTQYIMQIVNIMWNGNSYINENLKNFVKKAMHSVDHSMYLEKPTLLLMVNLCW